MSKCLSWMFGKFWVLSLDDKCVSIDIEGEGKIVVCPGVASVKAR